MKRIVPVLEFTEKIGKVGMVDRLAGIVRDEVLFGHVGHVVGLVVFREEMVKRLVLWRPAVFGNRGVPLIRVREHGIDIEDNAPKRVLAVPYDLAK